VSQHVSVHWKTEVCLHACGYKLANDGHDTRSLQDYLGHRNIQNTVRYTALSPTRFRTFWPGLMSDNRNLSIIKLSRPHRKVKDQFVDISKTSGAARYFEKVVREVEQDLGGKRILSRIERELITAFAGAATTIQYLNRQVLLGDTAEIDLCGYATMASTMLRIGSRIGLRRVTRDVTTLGDILKGAPDG
jgi:hypothetical protein